MHYEGFLAWRAHLRQLGIDDVRDLRVLDIGCGDRAQLSILFAMAGATVIGLDPQPVALGWHRPRMWLATVRGDGVVKGGRLVVRDLIHTFRYWRRLSALVGRKLAHGSVKVVQGDAAALPFEDASFDIVLSSAVWEHLPDVDRATCEVSRVLRGSGIAIIQIALFPALQGGHHPEWHSVGIDQRRHLRPWDHLRVARYPLPTYLNEWRESQYRESLERCLRVIEWEDGAIRGNEYLDEATRAELRGFTERDLLLSSLTAWARRKEAS